MSANTERVEMRVPREFSEQVRKAAELVHEPTSAFMRTAVMVRAERVLARANVTLMPAEQFDELMASLDAPDEAPPALAEAARQPRAYVHK